MLRCLFVFVFVFVLFCFFAFHFSKRLKFCFGSTKMEIFYREKAFHTGKKSGKMNLPPQKKFSCYAPGSSDTNCTNKLVDSSAGKQTKTILIRQLINYLFATTCPFKFTFKYSRNRFLHIDVENKTKQTNKQTNKHLRSRSNLTFAFKLKKITLILMKSISLHNNDQIYIKCTFSYFLLLKIIISYKNCLIWCL